MSTVTITKRTSQYGQLFHVGQRVTCSDVEAQRLVGLQVAEHCNGVLLEQIAYDDEFSIVIPYRADGGQRDQIYEWCIRRWQALFPNAEIVSENDDSVGLPNRSRMRNRSALKASHDILLITDGDIVPDSRQIHEAVRLLVNNKRRWVSPLSHIYFYNKSITDDIIHGSLLGDIPITRHSLDSSKWAHGIIDHSYVCSSPQCLMTKDVFSESGGFDERFIYWGCEDLAYGIKLATLFQVPLKMTHTVVHLWHPLVSSGHLNHSYTDALLQEYRSADGNISRMRELIDKCRMGVTV